MLGLCFHFFLKWKDWVPEQAGFEANEIADSIAQAILKNREVVLNISQGQVELLSGKIKEGFERDW